MKRFIFGFQRRVWWPKWTPASRSSRMETTAKGLAPFVVGLRCSRRGAGGTERKSSAPPPVLVAGTEELDAGQSSGSAPVEPSLRFRYRSDMSAWDMLGDSPQTRLGRACLV